MATGLVHTGRGVLAFAEVSVMCGSGMAWEVAEVLTALCLLTLLENLRFLFPYWRIYEI
jgi:hypothetical protein